MSVATACPASVPASLEPVLSAIPAHVGIIMDGNGRWAQRRNLPRTAGHKEGLNAAKQVVKMAADIGVKCVTLYAFSTENWKRTVEEVGFLMNLVLTHLRGEFAFYKKNGIRIRHIGDIAGLPANVAAEIRRATADTAGFTGLTVTLAVNYGSRNELARAFSKMLNDGVTDCSEDSIQAHLDEPALPDVDLLIRTGGEQRLSNFLLWQAAYAELVFSRTLWPDYGADEFRRTLAEFGARSRRFGGA
nr:polyprenyl diphosphate synthase [Treponema endosymbiont of Eucomonympha sp.]